MTHIVTGLHHVTAITGDAQRNHDFYTGVLGLRLVKKTVNFDDPTAYHFYYGDAVGSPGSIVTFFAWPRARRGQPAVGAPTAITFAAPKASLDFWQQRLAERAIAVKRETRFGGELLAFADPDGIRVEIAASDVAASATPAAAGFSASVPAEHALRGMQAVALSVAKPAVTAQLLTSHLGYALVGSEGTRSRYENAATPGRFVELIETPASAGGGMGAGTIHHLAFRVADDDAQAEMQATIDTAGFAVSDVRDRDYFRSIYFREHGGVLFEIATDVPGFAVDEPVESLGASLKLPRQFESARAEIERRLPPLRTTAQPVGTPVRA